MWPQQHEVQQHHLIGDVTSRTPLFSEHQLHHNESFVPLSLFTSYLKTKTEADQLRNTRNRGNCTNILKPKNTSVLDSCLCLGETTFLTLLETIRTHSRHHTLISFCSKTWKKPGKTKCILWRLHWFMSYNVVSLFTAQPPALVSFWSCLIKCKVKKISVIQDPLGHRDLDTQPKLAEGRRMGLWPALTVVSWFSGAEGDAQSFICFIYTEVLDYNHVKPAIHFLLRLEEMITHCNRTCGDKTSLPVSLFTRLNPVHILLHNMRSVRSKLT